MKKFLFYTQGISPGLSFTKTITEHFASILKSEQAQVKRISFIFCTDDYLLTLNQTYLKHNTLTDVITFTLSETNAPFESEIYISVERVRDNAKTLKTDYHQELFRVMIHGILHLCGYKDKTLPQKTIMREKEDFYLSSLDFTAPFHVKRST